MIWHQIKKHIGRISLQYYSIPEHNKFNESNDLEPNTYTCKGCNKVVDEFNRNIHN